MTRTVVAATGRHTIRTKERIDECNEHVKSRPLERPRFPCPLFLAVGAPKLIGRGLERWTGFSDLPRAQVVFTGIMEVLGAAGLILPMATGILPWLTPLAAVGLAIIVLMASGFHQRANERLAALETVGQ